ATGPRLVYLDSAASSQKPRTVIEAMSQYYAQSHANVHRSIHTLGEEATELYELARDRVQRFIGAASREEVVLTRGTTDGINLLAEALGRGLRPGDEGRITDLEHHSNIVPGPMAVRGRGAGRGRARDSADAGGAARPRRARSPARTTHARRRLRARLQRAGNDPAGGRDRRAGPPRGGGHRGRWGSGGASPAARHVRAG